MGKLQDKVAIITGGAGGIGQGIATAFVKEGAKVAILDLDEQSGQKVVERLQKHQPESMFIQADLANHDKLKDIVDQVVDKFGKLDILVNNAHASKAKPFLEITQQDLDLSFNTGFYPTFYLMQAAIPHLQKTEGNIINFASGAGIEGHATQGAYAAAKEGIRALTRVTANEFGKDSINVNLIAPIANSPGVQQWAKEEPEYYQQVLENIPMRRFGELEEDIGHAAVFLASEDSSYITGQTINVDGGSVKF
ncbi:SDR family NAD(P)-dependent oxidoreductase [Barrientosiimonas marina]|uniref:SDR family NAD(P)-dependent oxidoreductase n=1 Tax=Lentibacillus kimchii TaxID=1542911 RepID=A0ABW2UUZ2_9BACI